MNCQNCIDTKSQIANVTSCIIKRTFTYTKKRNSPDSPVSTI